MTTDEIVFAVALVVLFMLAGGLACLFALTFLDDDIAPKR